ISGNTYVGIRLESAKGTIVQGNFLGTNVTAKAPLPNGVGIAITGGTTNVTIGGTTPLARNVIGPGGVVIAGSVSGGVVVAPTSGIVVQGNYVGVGADGITPLPMGIGIQIAG